MYSVFEIFQGLKIISNMSITTTIIERQNLRYFDIRIYTMFLYFRLELRANYSNLFDMVLSKNAIIFKISKEKNFRQSLS